MNDFVKVYGDPTLIESFKNPNLLYPYQFASVVDELTEVRWI